MGRLTKVSHRFRRVSVCMFWAMSKVPNSSLIRNDCQDGVCQAVLRKVPDDRWVLDNPLVLDDPLIRDDRQGKVCRTILG